MKSTLTTEVNLSLLSNDRMMRLAMRQIKHGLVRSANKPAPRLNLAQPLRLTIIMASSMDDPQAQARDVVQQLQSPISDLSSLLALLSGPLDCLGLLPPQFRRYNANPLPSGSISLPKHVPLLQRALLEHIAPVWDTSMAEANATLLLEQYFCPDSFSFASSVSGDVTLLAYSTILSLPLTSFSAHLLARLSAEYPVDRLHSAVFSHHDDSTKESLAWEDYVRNIAAVPAKVANAFGATGEIPPALEHATYFNSVSRRCESLVASLADQSVDGGTPSLLSNDKRPQFTHCRKGPFGNLHPNQACEPWCLPSHSSDISVSAILFPSDAPTDTC